MMKGKSRTDNRAKRHGNLQTGRVNILSREQKNENAYKRKRTRPRQQQCNRKREKKLGRR